MLEVVRELLWLAQDQDSLLVKRRNDNHSPGPGGPSNPLKADYSQQWHVHVRLYTGGEYRRKKEGNAYW